MRIIISAALFLLSACSYRQDCRAVQGDIAKFHSAYNSGNFQHMYFADSGPAFRKAISAAAAIELFGRFRDKLGTYVIGHESGCNINYTASGTYLSIHYETRFQKGGGMELFTYAKSDEGLKLVGYHIDSKALVAP